MVLIETDFLIALSSKKDKHHDEVRGLLEKLDTITLSPYSLIELDLLLASRKIIVKIPDYYDILNSLLSYYGIAVSTPDPAHFYQAWTLRKRYDLTFFGSLHAAAAIKEGETLISYDNRYSAIRELKYKHQSRI
jgi:predicted nucleic acid-binding protein